MPTAFEGEGDSVSIGDIVWRDFFADPKLVALIDTGINRNLNLLSAVQRIEIARANYDIRRGALLPSLDGRYRLRSGNIRNNALRGTINGDDNVDAQTAQWFVGLQSTWEADLWGKLRSKREASYARFLATERGVHLVTTSIVAEVARLYYELLGLDYELNAIRRNIELQEVGQEVIQIQKIGGRATELAVQQFQAQLLRTRSLEYERRQRMVEVENQLNLLLGRYPQPIERGDSLAAQQLPEFIDAGVPSDLLRRRPDVQQAELVLIAAKADVAAAKAAFLPSLTFTPYMGFQSDNLPSLFTTPESLVLGLLNGITAPIFQQNRLEAEYAQMVAQNWQSFYDYQQSILSGYQEVLTSLQRVENFRQAYELRQQEADVLLAAVSTSSDLFAAGYATYLEVITAQERVLEAELGMINTRKEIFLALTSLYQSLGGGWQ
ncbi:efflux transporter outer membrane subunit [Tunicatimonas pelagia]|uniref:efflux transporter outer membrane subunit n=1 Tax=Tunicatimonas pelagia TaxID=931531 RepID=UPI002665B4B4|nr:efflux transporter outer membrane subunit [Tunicatimonas pelagia]WKN46179.1 efflux transporter outer membrane subunit [Tunicatimonas pelagia]